MVPLTESGLRASRLQELEHRTGAVTRRKLTPSSAKETGLKDIEILLGMRLFLVLRCVQLFLFQYLFLGFLHILSTFGTHALTSVLNLSSGTGFPSWWAFERQVTAVIRFQRRTHRQVCGRCCNTPYCRMNPTALVAPSRCLELDLDLEPRYQRPSRQFLQ